MHERRREVPGTAVRFFRSAIASACAWAALAGHTPSSAHPNIDERLAGLTRRIAEHPSDALLYLRRGELHRIHGEFDAAESDYRSARRIDPDLARIDLCFGSLLADQGRLDEAELALGRFLAAQPDDLGGLTERARILSRLGEPIEAARAWTAAIEAARADPGPQPDWYLARSRALLDDAAARATSTSDAWACGDAMERIRVAQAIAALDEGIERLGQPVALQLEAIDLELSAGHYDEALERLDRIAALEKAGGEYGPPAPRRGASIPDIAMRRARILERAGRSVEAREAYGEVLTAIEALPAARRSTPAVASLAADAAAALDRVLLSEAGKDSRREKP